VGVKHFFEKAIIPGKIYPTVYVTRQHFTGTLLDGRAPRFHYAFNVNKNVIASAINRYNFRWRKYPYKTFIVIRDLRDILVSQYFSVLVSHPQVNLRITEYRQELSSLDKEDGLLSLIHKRLPLQAAIQESWLPAWQNGGVLLVRFEDMLEDEHGCLEKIISYCQIDVERHRLHDIITQHSFQMSTGRQPGEEDISSHLRKGIAGDWMNHFTDEVRKEFKKRFGQLLIDTGYERGLEW
jgi:lipopolysaccharide transport system ATP-binding protein